MTEGVRIALRRFTAVRRRGVMVNYRGYKSPKFTDISQLITAFRSQKNLQGLLLIGGNPHIKEVSDTKKYIFLLLQIKGYV